MESLLTIPCTSCADRLQNENDEILDDKGKNELNGKKSMCFVGVLSSLLHIHACQIVSHILIMTCCVMSDHQSSSSWLDVMKSCCGITPTDEEEDEALLMECRWIPVCGRM